MIMAMPDTYDISHFFDLLTATVSDQRLKSSGNPMESLHYNDLGSC